MRRLAVMAALAVLAVLAVLAISAVLAARPVPLFEPETDAWEFVPSPKAPAASKRPA